MTTSTRELITTLINADATISAPERADILLAINRTPQAPSRLLKADEVAKRLSVSKATVRKFTRAGALVRFIPAGGERAAGYTEASVEAMAKGAK